MSTVRSPGMFRLAACLAALVIGLVHGSAALACGPTPGGPPSPCAAAGNPIDLTNGNKFQREVDYAPAAGQLGVEVVRFYNRSDHTGNATGFGWRLSYESRVFAIGDTLQISMADGSRLTFDRDPANPALCGGHRPEDGRLRIERGQGDRERFRWEKLDGERVSFDEDGYIAQIENSRGDRVIIARGLQGELLRASDSRGHILEFRYGNPRAKEFAGLASILTPAGVVQYRHDDEKAAPGRGNLTSVALPDGSSRIYHYEKELQGGESHPHALTGISLVDASGRAERVETWSYDTQGRAVTFERGAFGKGAHRIDLRFERSAAAGGTDEAHLGLTLLTNSKGEVTRYRHALVGEERVLVEAQGPGCEECEAANRRFQYDDRARMTGMVDLVEGSTRVRGSRKLFRDALGRVVREVIQAEGGSSDPGRAQAVEIRTEYEAGSARPTRIVRPSVVPGRESEMRIRYRADGSVDEVEETGFRSVVSGGLPRVASMERRTRFQYDGAGRLVSVSGALGGASGETRYFYDAAGQLNAVERDGVRSDWTGSDSGGNAGAGTVRRRVSDGAHILEFTRIEAGPGAAPVIEVAGWLAGEGGKRLADSEVRFRAQAPALAAAPWAAAGFEGQAPTFDVASGRVRWSGPAGATRIDAFAGTPGTSAENEIVRFEDGGGASVERVLDDFGRVVALRYPGQAWQMAEYDSLDRIREIIAADGTRSVVTYNGRGQPVRVERFKAAGLAAAKAVQLVRYEYAGVFVLRESVTDEAGTRTTSFERDALGRAIRTTLRIEGLTAQPIEWALRTSYDGQGRVASKELDGFPSVEYGYDDKGRVRSIGLASMLGSRSLLSNVAWLDSGSLSVATSIAFGNGRNSHATFARTGQLSEYDDGVRKLLDSTAGVSPEDARPVQVATAPGPQRGAESQIAGKGPTPADAMLLDAGYVGPLERPGDAHDTAGRPTRILSLRGQLGLAWGPDDRLQSVSRDGEVLARYVYDARGRRVAKVLRGAGGQPDRIVAFFSDGAQNLGEAQFDPAGTRIDRTQLVYLGLRPVARLWAQEPTETLERVRQKVRGPEIRFVHTDHRGAVTALSGEDGQVLWQADVGPWGLPRVKIDLELRDQPLRMIGQYADVESGLVYHGARYYDPLTGMFLTPDPAGVEPALRGGSGSLNSYRYAEGQPWIFVDPDGAATIQYFAIDNGTLASANYMPDSGHWAFAITGLASSPLDVFLYDAGGTFFPSYQKPYQLYTNNTSNPLAPFVLHYQSPGFYSPASFTITISDKDAQAIIDNLLHPAAKGTCATPMPAFPSIDLGLQGKLNPMASNAQPTRIVNCPSGSSDQTILLQRLLTTVEVHETLDKNCATSAFLYCPSNSWTPALNPAAGNSVMKPSFGWGQTTFGTLLDILNRKYSSYPGLAALGITSADVTTANNAANAVPGLMSSIGSQLATLMAATPQPAITTVANTLWGTMKANNTGGTYLSQGNFVRIVYWEQLITDINLAVGLYKSFCPVPINPATGKPVSSDRIVASCFKSLMLSAKPPTPPAGVAPLTAAQEAQRLALSKEMQSLTALLGTSLSSNDLNPYIRLAGYSGDITAAFQAAAALSVPGGFGAGVMQLFSCSQGVNCTAAAPGKAPPGNKALYDQITLDILKSKMNIAINTFKAPSSPTTVAQEVLLASWTLAAYNGYKAPKKGPPPATPTDPTAVTYLNSTLPIFNNTYCLAGTGNPGYLKMTPLVVKP